MRRTVLALLITLLVAAIARADEKASDSLAAKEQAAVRSAVARVADSVVQIRTIGGLDEVDQTLLPNGPTTGLIISPDGWIVSSAFNFVQQPASILVTFPSGEQAPARLVAKDHSRMLVLLKVQGVDDLPVPDFVKAADVRIGQWSIAVGRTFRADRPNISVGIVSALGRMFGKVIQTDADVSTANYGGPLVDIHGRVLGVLVPIAPQTTSELAGAEWYDSGIGFAVPLAEIGAAIDRMKDGQDQRAGVLGVSVASENPHDSPATIVAVLPNSPAGAAGFKKGDRIDEIDGHPIHTQNDMRFALGPRYAGEEVHVTVVRDKEKIEQTMKLAGELPPFRHAFLGILPLRDDADAATAVGASKDATEKPAEKSSEADKRPADDDEQAEPPADEGNDEPDAKKSEAAKTEAEKPVRCITVRYVYPASPAATAGIRPGDRIIRIDDADISTIRQATTAMNAKWPESQVAVRIIRDDKPLDLAIMTARLPTNIPTELPPAYASPAPARTADAAKAAAAGPRELKIAEFSETCKAYVPPSHDGGRPSGLVLWIHAPGDAPNDAFFARWKSICDRDGLVLVAPTAADPSRWERTELEYLRRLTERAIREYKIDRARVVVCGQAGGGAMAYFLALLGRNVFSGVATTDAALPRNVQVPPNEPTARLAVFAGLPTDTGRLAQTEQGLKKLTDAGYPVTAEVIANSAGQFSDEELQMLARWIDTLDRF